MCALWRSKLLEAQCVIVGPFPMINEVINCEGVRIASAFYKLECSLEHAIIESSIHTNRVIAQWDDNCKEITEVSAWIKTLNHLYIYLHMSLFTSYSLISCYHQKDIIKQYFWASISYQYLLQCQWDSQHFFLAIFVSSA